MRDFDYKQYKDQITDHEILKFLEIIKFYQENLTVFKQINPTSLKNLSEKARLNSIEYSNRIEGIFISREKFNDLILENLEPKVEAEKEIAGYRDVYDLIDQNFNNIPLNSNIILQFHRNLLKHISPDKGGHFKNTSNVIVWNNLDGTQTILFEPLSPIETPDAMIEICKSFNRCISENNFEVLLLIPLFILDFLCIHPFFDGNGRISRLLTMLLLYKSGYSIGKYISLEKIIEETKTEYYNSLIISEDGWKFNKEDPQDFIKYFLKTLILAYQELEDRLNRTEII